MSLITKARLTGHRSQQTFDVLLRTLAEPGTVRVLPPSVLDDEIPTPAWLALALADVDVTVNVADDLDHPVAKLVRDATGARLVALDDAWLVVLPEPTAEQLGRITIGDALHPELGARVALGVAGLYPDGGGEIDVSLEGPGVPGHRTLGIDGTDPALLAGLGQATGTFPAGFDTWLCTPTGQVAAIARSTTVTGTTAAGTTAAARARGGR